MIKIEIREVPVYHCDICGVMILKHRLNICSDCGRHLCKKHIIKHNEDEDGYYPICSDCLFIRKPFEERIKEIKKEMNKALNKLRSDVKGAILHGVESNKIKTGLNN